jgi:hypothetical protein
MSDSTTPDASADTSSSSSSSTETDTETTRQDEITEAFDDMSESVEDVATPSPQGGEGKPDPSDVEPVDASQHVYQRDENGDLIPEPAVVKIDGDWQRVEHLPPAKGFLMRVQNKFGGRDEVDMEEIDDLMDDFYTHPKVENWDDTSTSFYISLMRHMVAQIMGDVDDETTQELRSAVEERQTQGN